MNVLVYSEGWSGAPDPDALGVLSKAFSLGEPVTAVVCGGAAEEFMAVFASHGAGRILAVHDRSFAEPVYTARVDALETVAVNAASRCCFSDGCVAVAWLPVWRCGLRPGSAGGSSTSKLQTEI